MVRGRNLGGANDADGCNDVRDYSPNMIAISITTLQFFCTHKPQRWVQEDIPIMGTNITTSQNIIISTKICD
jgi:hypothetical protein